MREDFAIYLAIGGAAFVTYTLRLGGLLLADRLPQRGRFRVFMEALPGTILLSLIVPAVVAAGLWGWIATLCTALFSVRTGNVLGAMIIGVTIVAFGRYISG